MGVDRSADAIDSLSELVALGQAQLVQADIENGPWPLMEGPRPRQFNAVVVTRYLWRPLLTTILESLAPAGVLLYETFASGNESVGKPSRPDFLLSPGELLQVCAHLHIVAYENGYCEHPPSFTQRIVAVKFPFAAPVDDTTTPPRFAL